MIKKCIYFPAVLQLKIGDYFFLPNSSTTLQLRMEAVLCGTQKKVIIASITA